MRPSKETNSLPKVDLDVPFDDIKGTNVDSIPSEFKSNIEALAGYCQELETLAAKYRVSSEEIVNIAIQKVDVFNSDFERALTLNRRIKILKNA